jgi:hypothetical protein
MDLSRQRLTDLRDGLLRLHKTLLDSERRIYEREVERIQTSGQLLSLVLHDPWFNYLHELSMFVVFIDETLDGEEPVTLAGAERMIRQARALLTPREEGAGFERRYFEALQRDPDVVIAHAATLKLLVELS